MNKNIILVMLLFVATISTQAQVTIGSDTSPADYSILELISGGDKGLRLPQVNSHVRDSLTIEFTTGINLISDQKDLALGLQIFNIDNLCVETWNGAEWISACAMCGDQPCVYYPLSGVSPNGSITTFVNVMYDFQHQTLEAYGFTDGTPVSYQWYAKRRGTADTEYKGIYGATAITYTAPADFVKNIFQPLVSDNDTNYNDSIIFVCLAKYSDGTYEQSAGMDILFIGTNTGGYGYDIIDGKKFRYLTLKKAVSGGTFIDFNVALLNLGQSDNDDAGDLGDFYQWGRIPDGHQITGWSKDPLNHKDTIYATDPLLTVDGNVTSASVARNASAFYDAHLQLTSENADDYYKKFIIKETGLGDWGEETTSTNSRWGIGSVNNNNRDSDIPLSEWIHPSNNPCPAAAGWYVPSRWNFWDLYKGTGSDVPPTSVGAYGNENNTWTCRNIPAWNSSDNFNFTVGGALITNDDDEILFLPASGCRNMSDDYMRFFGTYGFYWSSTNRFSGNNAYYMQFTSGGVAGTGGNGSAMAFGYSVRCVQAVPAP